MKRLGNQSRFTPEVGRRLRFSRQRRLDTVLGPWRKHPQTDHVVEMFLPLFEKWKDYAPK